VIVELGQNTVFGVGIQSEPGYSRGVSHNKPFVVVDLFNCLADACRMRICSFNESLNYSVQQVVRFSIYQQATRDGVSSSVSPCGTDYVISPACLSSGRSAITTP
jgi:hypothetical protein